MQQRRSTHDDDMLTLTGSMTFSCFIFWSVWRFDLRRRWRLVGGTRGLGRSVGYFRCWALRIAFKSPMSAFTFYDTQFRGMVLLVCHFFLPSLPASSNRSARLRHSTGPGKTVLRKTHQMPTGQSELCDINHEHIIIDQTSACIRSSPEEDPMTIVEGHWGTTVDIQARKKP